MPKKKKAGDSCLVLRLFHTQREDVYKIRQYKNLEWYSEIKSLEYPSENIPNRKHTLFRWHDKNSYCFKDDDSTRKEYAYALFKALLRAAL